MKKFAVSLAVLSVFWASLVVTPKLRAQEIQAPAVSTTLVLSQVSGGNGTYADDWVEIKNVSGTSQPLNGLSLYYGSATGNFGAGQFALPNVSVAAGQYYLVRLPQGLTGAA